MMRGSVGLKKGDGILTLLGFARKYRAEVVTGDEQFMIRWRQEFSNGNTHYELLHSAGVLQHCSLIFDGKLFRMNLSFRADQFLEYQLGPSGIGKFRTRDGEVSTAIEVPGNRRCYEIDEMRFEHADYRSSMSFECPSGRFHQAVFVANLLFNPPEITQEG